jgi:hypothetical protein
MPITLWPNLGVILV